MAKRKMKQLALAVGTVLGSLSLMPSAQAVNLATDGLGQVLIFPYYTTRGGWTTLFNVTNTSDRVVAAKVRFHEAYNSRDVLDFTIVLSPHDVWTAWVENGPGDVPRIRTNDNSCTVPAIPAEGQTFAGGTLAYTGAFADGGPTGTDRLREGYVKVLMNGASTVAAVTNPIELAYNAVHVNGVPRNCGIIQQAFSTNNIAALRGAFPDYNSAINPLKGSFNIVNGPRGLTAGGNAVVLADFYDQNLPPAPCPVDVPNCYVAGPPGTNYLMTLQLPPSRTGVYTTSFHEPNLNASNTAGQVLNEQGIVRQSNTLTPPTGANAVNFVLGRNTIANQWTRKTEGATSWITASDWVITHPTKRYYVDLATNEMAGRALGRPGLPADFPAPFFVEAFDGQSCVPVTYRIFDREEFTIVREDGPVFSPAPSERGNELCYETNVLSFGGSSILNSGTAITANIDQLPGPNGWVRLDYGTNVNRSVIGFSITTRDTGDGALNEGFLVDHSYTRP
jgi:hypothetical protein